MRYKLSVPSTVKATIQLPASKSISNRALILNALAQGTTPPCNLSDCDDTLVMIKALDGNNETIDIMAAGTAMRFLTAYLRRLPEPIFSPEQNGCSSVLYKYWSMPYVN